MSSSTRKLAGTIVLLVFLTVYALMAMMVAASLEVHKTSKWVELIYYVVAGLLWVLPAGLIIGWMSRPDTAPADE